MLLARAFDRDERITARPGALGICPGCRSDLSPKCGEIRIWHWSHRAANDCDRWRESESAWHLSWKAKAPADWCEVVMGPHRADICRDDGLVIELQHSAIDPASIREREQFYGSMAWLIDLRDCQHHVSLSGSGETVAFRWMHARRSWAGSTKPKFFDLGDRVLEVLTLSEDAARGTGRVLSVDAFLAWARLAPMTAAERASPVRYEITRSNDRAEYLFTHQWGRPPSTLCTEYERGRALAAGRSAPSFADWSLVGALELGGHTWHVDRCAPLPFRSFDYHTIDVAVVSRSGRRQTLQRDPATLVRRGNCLALDRGFGDPLALYRRVVAPVCRRIGTTMGDKWALPMARSAATKPQTARTQCPPPPPKALAYRTVRTSTGNRRALPLMLARVEPTIQPICPPPERPKVLTPERDWDGRWGRIVREPDGNVFGRFKVLRRTDDLFVVVDVEGPLGRTWPIFNAEADARRWAARRAGAAPR